MFSRSFSGLTNLGFNTLAVRTLRVARVKFLVLLPTLVFLPFSYSVAGELGLCLTPLTGISGCTANESAISAINIIKTIEPCTSASDTGTFNLTADLSGGNTKRYDLGLYLNVNGGNAESDTTTDACFHEIFQPATASSGADSNCATDGQGPFFDGDSDVCGDIEAAPGNCTLDAVRGFSVGLTATIADITLKCSDLGPVDADGYLDLDACNSYHQNKTSADACTTGSGATTFTQLFEGIPTAPIGAGIPGTSSKCKCTGKVNTVPLTPYPDLALSCGCGAPSSIGPSGFAVECTATIDNNANFTATTGTNSTEPGAAAMYDFDLSSVAPAGVTTVGTITPTVETSDAALPGAGSTVNWQPQGGANSPTTAGVIGANEEYSLSFTYFIEGDDVTDGTYTINVDGNWSDGTDSADDVLTTSGCSVDVMLTYASIENVHAQLNDKQVELTWETSTEIGSVGFDVYRLDHASKGYKKVNWDLLPASQNTSGGFYRFVDMGATPAARMSYKILERTTGLDHWHGPYELTLNSSMKRLAQSTEANSNASQLRVDLDDYQVRSRVDQVDHDRSSTVNKTKDKAKKSHKNTSSIEQANKLPISAVTTAAATGEQIRIEVSKDGIYSLSATEIASQLGISEKAAKKSIRKGSFSLRNGDNSVAWEAINRNQGIRFYGLANTSIYSDRNVYWFTQGTGESMATSPSSVRAPAPAGLTFASTVHFEQDTQPRYYIAEDPLEDYWYWLVTANGWGGEASGLETPHAATDGFAELTIELYSFTATATFDVSLNGTPLGPVTVSGIGKHDNVPVSFDSTLLHELLQASNTVTVDGVSGITNIDSFELRYAREYSASDNRLSFNGDGNSLVTIDGFGNDSISVYDVSNPLQPVRIEDVLIDFNDSYRVTIEPSAANTSYLAFASGGERTADQVTAYTPSNLDSPANAYEYLIIGPADFANAAQVLIDHRVSGGYSAAFVSLEAVVNEFNYGILDPEAIRTFLAYAHSNWSVGPELVTIAGSGSFDYKSNISTGNLVPPLMVMTTYGGLASSENRFGDFSGSPVPEVFVSRVPAVSPEELSAYIDKVIDYELAGHDSWQDEVVFVADNAEQIAGDFPNDSSELVTLMPSGTTAYEMYVGNGPEPHVPPYYSAATVNELLMDAFDEGAAVVNYVGHGAVTQLANENLFDQGDVPLLSNQGRLPLVTALTCNIAFYSFPVLGSLAESLLLEPGVGAIGVWAPTLLSGNAQAIDLGAQLLPHLVQADGMAFGLIARQSLQNFLDEGGNPALIPIYDFFGDSALQLK